ncbi:MAG: GFA family protein [Alphaproteobacteria bacterium]
MKLEGSCHCGAVRFAVEAETPYAPYMRCYCTICRKTAGGGGYAINLFAKARTLTVRGGKHIRVYRVRAARIGDDPSEPRPKGRLSECRRHFCGICGSALWVFDPRWPDLLHPFASAIDTPLPKARRRKHVMLDFKAPWVDMPRRGPRDLHFRGYP